MAPPKSRMWKHMFEKHPTLVLKRICKLCPIGDPKRIVGCGTDPKKLNTSNMIQHAKKHHKAEYEADEKLHEEEYGKKRKEPDSLFDPSPTPKKQNTLFASWDKIKIWDVNDDRAKEINIRLAKILVGGCYPINICEDAFFLDLMSILHKNYKVPCRDFMTRKVIPSMNDSVTDKVKGILQNADNMSFTTDIWTAPHANDCFLSFTAHIMTKEFDNHCVVLRAYHFDERHTAEQVTVTLDQIMIEYGIPKSKIHYIVSDNASAMVKGVTDVDVPHLSCFLHTLNLIINNSIFVQESNKKLIDKCKQLVSLYKKSPIAKSEFDNIKVDDDQHDPGRKLRLIQDIAIRWNSTHKMLKRIFECKSKVAAFLCETTIDINIDITCDDWIKIEKLVIILGQFDAITNQ